MNLYSDFKEIVINDTPLIDVRAPVEFNKGSFNNTVNLPLMYDEERRRVGICYKEKGHDSAVELGHTLVSGKKKNMRVELWKSFIKKHPECKLFCFRGGMRSEIVQQWIKVDTGLEIPKLEGGYKAFRNFLISMIDIDLINSKPLLLGGCTGSGKTILLNQLENAIDLEGLANHRGSSFGQHVYPQPTQINFENSLASAIIKHNNRGFNYMVVEDEGRYIGRCSFPKTLVEYFNQGRIVILNVSLEERINITTEEYVIKFQKEYETIYLKTGIMEWADYIRNSLKRITKRLGNERYNEVINLFELAFQKQLSTGEIQEHKKWIEVLLRDYYDPMYQHQIQKKADRIIFQGNNIEVLGYLKDLQ
jgi:tRNA 2-selenouridine synthase